MPTNNFQNKPQEPPKSKKKTFHMLLDELNSDMQIVAYTGFSSQYKTLDVSTIKWLILNFKKTTAIVMRQKKMLAIPIEKLKVKDRLEKIHHFPPELKKLSYVTPSLIRELENRNFTEFEVILIKKTEDSIVHQWENKKKEKQKKVVDNVSKYITSANVLAQKHETLSNLIEEVMDNARENKFSYRDIEEQAEELIANNSLETLSAFTSLKQSNQTYTHCIDVGSIFQHVYWRLVEKKRLRSHFTDKKSSLLASFLHDFGKSQIPKEILDSNVKFAPDSKEAKIIRTHPELGAKLLHQFSFSTTAINISHYHHVKYTPTLANSYPFIKDYKEVLYETRLLSIIDIYQALIGKRSYKKSWNPASAIQFIGKLAAIEFDPVVWLDFVSIIGKYPTNSYVELSDGSFGFVTPLPYQETEKPIVIVVENKDNEILKHNPIIDLSIELDISIVNTHDSIGRFKDKTLDVFLNLNAI